MKETISFWQSTIDERYRETLSMIHPGKDIDQAIREAFGHLSADPLHLAATEPHQFKRLVNTWLGYQKIKTTAQTSFDDIKRKLGRK